MCVLFKVNLLCVNQTLDFKKLFLYGDKKATVSRLEYKIVTRFQNEFV